MGVGIVTKIDHSLVGAAVTTGLNLSAFLRALTARQETGPMNFLECTRKRWRIGHRRQAVDFLLLQTVQSCLIRVGKRVPLTNS